jgi:hypothetical protein
MSDLETRLRETLRERATDIAFDAVASAAHARRRARRQQTSRYAVLGAAAVVLAIVAAVFTTFGGHEAGQPMPGGPREPDTPVTATSLPTGTALLDLLAGRWHPLTLSPRSPTDAALPTAGGSRTPPGASRAVEQYLELTRSGWFQGRDQCGDAAGVFTVEDPLGGLVVRRDPSRRGCSQGDLARALVTGSHVFANRTRLDLSDAGGRLVASFVRAGPATEPLPVSAASEVAGDWVLAAARAPGGAAGRDTVVRLRAEGGKVTWTEVVGGCAMEGGGSALGGSGHLVGDREAWIVSTACTMRAGSSPVGFSRLWNDTRTLATAGSGGARQLVLLDSEGLEIARFATTT